MNGNRSPIRFILCRAAIPIVLLILRHSDSWSQRVMIEKYCASAIPVTLLPGSNAVVRYHSETFTVKSRKKAFLKIHHIVTILNPEGRLFGELPLFYNKFIVIEDLDGCIYDADGKEIRSLSDDDVKDYPVNINSTLYSDYRARVATLFHNVYPYTIEYEYELYFNGYINWPSWSPEEKNAAIEYSRFEVKLLNGIQLRYWKNIDIEPVIHADGDERSYIWEASDLRPFEPEPLGPPMSDQYATVEIAPELFEIDGFEGDLRTWKSLGGWYYSLSKDGQTLSEKLKRDIQKCIEGITGVEEKVRRLYRLMQSMTRYVNITLGIGGWQPYDAMYVCERGYGDCKALSNFMISLLQAANIPSYPVLINSGSPPGRIVEDFPANKFNHVIVCVPCGKDTLWLECTSQSLLMGQLSYNTENRLALLITPQGGSLVKTPASTAQQNCQIRKATVSFVSDGDATAEIETQYTGFQRDYLCGLFQNLSPKEKDDWSIQSIHIPTFNVKKMDFSGIESNAGDGRIQMVLALPGFASTAGKQLLFSPNLMEKRTYVPKECTQRKYPVVQSYPYLDIDSITFILPSGFYIDALPNAVVIEKPFARYSSVTTQIADNALRYIRRLEIKESMLPPKMYDEYRGFIRDIVQADRALATLTRKE